MMSYRHVLPLSSALVFAHGVQSQTPVRRDEAVASAVAAGARLALARADTSAAAAAVLNARATPNPALSITYSKAVPSYHVTVDLPLDLPAQRRARIGAARAARAAAHYRFAFERAAAALDADTTYSLALAARERARLSGRTARDADSLRRMVAARRDAGDASDLDVDLATVAAGQLANLAAADSLLYASRVLDLQIVMGLAVESVAVAPSDSLTLPPGLSDGNDGLPAAMATASPLLVASAQADVESARLATRLQRRSIFGAPGIMAGVETGDPADPGLLPTLGISISLPVLNRNRGAIRQAEAEEARARAGLALAHVQSRTEIARARRQLAIALARVQRDERLVASATRVTAMALLAYREGAASLPYVLEAQRSGREVLMQYVDDVAAVWSAWARLRLFRLTPISGVP